MHGAALGRSLVILAFVHDGQDAFVVLGSHAYKGTYPHPEDGARAAHHEGDRHARYISETYRGGDDRGKRLHGRYLAVARVVFAAQLLQRGRQPPERHHSRGNEQVEASSDQEEEQRVAAEKVGHVDYVLSNSVKHNKLEDMYRKGIILQVQS